MPTTQLTCVTTIANYCSMQYLSAKGFQMFRWWPKCNTCCFNETVKDKKGYVYIPSQSQLEMDVVWSGGDRALFRAVKTVLCHALFCIDSYGSNIWSILLELIEEHKGAKRLRHNTLKSRWYMIQTDSTNNEQTLKQRSSITCFGHSHTVTLHL